MSFQNRMCCGRREGGKCLVAKEHDRELGDVTQFLAWHHFSSLRCGSAERVFPSKGMAMECTGCFQEWSDH